MVQRFAHLPPRNVKVGQNDKHKFPKKKLPPIFLPGSEHEESGIFSQFLYRKGKSSELVSRVHKWQICSIYNSNFQLEIYTTHVKWCMENTRTVYCVSCSQMMHLAAVNKLSHSFECVAFEWNCGCNWAMYYLEILCYNTAEGSRRFFTVRPTTIHLHPATTNQTDLKNNESHFVTTLLGSCSFVLVNVNNPLSLFLLHCIWLFGTIYGGRKKATNGVGFLTAYC